LDAPCETGSGANLLLKAGDAWDHDMLAVSDYVKVNPRTLEKCIRRSHEKYRPV
jgi:hypothetical protein